MFGRGSVATERPSNPFSGIPGPRRSSQGHTGPRFSELNLASLQRPQGSGNNQHLDMQLPWACNDYETSAFDARSVQHWRATSATTTASPVKALPSLMTTQSVETPSYMPPAMPDVLSPISDDSLQTQFGFDNFDACEFSPLALPHSMVGDTSSLLAPASTGTLDPRLTHPGTSGEESYTFVAPVTLGCESYSTPVSLASIETLSIDINPNYPLMNGGVPESHSQWINNGELQDESTFIPLFQDGFSQETRSPLSAVAMDRTISSHSHNSHWVSLSGSPVPSSPLDAFYSAEPQCVSEGQYIMAPQDKNESYNPLVSHDNLPSHLESSSVRPPHDYQAMPLPGLPLRHKDLGSFSVHSTLSTGNSKATRRLSSDVTEEPPPRHHEYYNVEKPKGELYECPYKATENCNHPPEALKCNYHKHLDSHFKPYRCKLPKCRSVVFSSTACQLRHEREAHGMHGHGEKPFRCDFPDCSRFLDGFPRRWNARDHMKRIHNHIPAESPSRSHSPSSSTVSSQSVGKATISARKRRTSSISKPEPSKRSKSGEARESAKIQKARSQKFKLQSLQKEWNEQRLALKERLNNLDPTKVLNPEQIATEYATLRDLGEELSRLSEEESVGPL